LKYKTYRHEYFDTKWFEEWWKKDAFEPDIVEYPINGISATEEGYKRYCYHMEYAKFNMSLDNISEALRHASMARDVIEYLYDMRPKELMNAAIILEVSCKNILSMKSKE
jgi:hypothetical protein